MNLSTPLLAATKNSPTEATLTIFGDIGPSEGFFGPTGMVDTEMVSKELAKLGDGITELGVNINSKGGDAYEGIGICNLLKSHPANVTVTIVGVAASAASLIAMAGDVVEMPANAQIMIHEARGFAFGTKSEIENAVKQIEATNQSAIATYVEKTGLSSDEIARMMAAETWMLGEEAKTKGFADKVTSKVKTTKPAASPANKLKFKNAPSNVIALLAVIPPDLKDSTMTDPTKPAAAVTSPIDSATLEPVLAPTSPALTSQTTPLAAGSTTVTTSADVLAANAAGREAERTRQTAIRSVFQAARVSTDAKFNEQLDKLTQEFCDAPTMSDRDAKDRLLTVLQHRNQVPASGTGTSPAPTQDASDPYAGFKLEYSAAEAVYQKMGVKEDAYIRTRCADHGIAPPGK